MTAAGQKHQRPEFPVSDDAQQQHYDRITERYESHYDDAWSRRYRSRFIDLPLLDGIDLAGKQVLEAMCGGGYTTRPLLSRGAHVTGLDLSEQAVRSFRRRWPQCEAVCRSIFHSGLEEASFDCVVVVGGLHHLPPRVTEGIDEIHRLLRVGGHFCFMEPHAGSLPDRIRQFWYRRDSLFAANESAIELEALKRHYASRFTFLKETYVGNVAYLLVLNSLVFRIPARLKRFYSRPLLGAEALLARLQNRQLSCIVVCQWQKK